MGKIPIAGNPDVSRGGYGGYIQARSTANFQPALAGPGSLPDFSGIGKGLESVAGAVNEHAARLEEAEVNSQIRLARAEDNAAVQSFLDGLETRNDYKNFADEWKNFSGEFSAVSDEVHPAAADYIKDNRQILLQRGSINLKRIVNAKRLDKIRGDQQYLIQGAVNAGNLEAVKELYTSGMKDGIFSNQEAQKGIAAAEGDIQKARITHTLMTGNVREMSEVKKALLEKESGEYKNYPALDNTSRLSLASHVAQAEKQQRQQRAQDLQHILNDPTAKPNDKLTAVIEAENEGLIHPAQANKMKDKILYPDDKFIASDYRKVDEALKMYANERIDRVRMLETISAAKLTKKDETYFRNRMNELDDPESPENKHEFKSAAFIVESTLEQMRPEIQDPSGLWNKKTDEETDLIIAQKQRNAINRIKKFIQENPKAGLNEVEEFTKTVLKPDSEKISSDAFRTIYAANQRRISEEEKRKQKQTVYNSKTEGD
jgi:hypothetical protein